MTTAAGDGEVCIVGAGLAGVAVAYRLREEPVDVTILEKSRGVGGRAATRRKHGCRYDHGANYIKDSDGRTDELVRELGTEGLVDIDEPVWTFDASGDIAPGDRQEAHKWSWTDGITQFAKRLLSESDATVKQSTRVDGLYKRDDGWTPSDTDGDSHGSFEGVVLTPPAPQTAELLASTTLAADNPAMSTLKKAIDAVREVPYRTVRTLVLQYPFETDRPYYALVNTDREHPIGWLARESCKEGHVPDGESLLIVQMAPDWSTAHYDDPLDSAADEVAGMVADLLDDDRLAEPGWVDDQGWRYAQPNAGLNDDAVSELRNEGLYVAGDWLVGEGRAHKAFWNGVDVGEAVVDDR
ncbi:NAD(P)/FAD-dependent oxidoreductase [Halohasta litorea]|uniref:NAD(P)/FAD-dependent oxidoreductase n=1 Tax=Halohasta litorea TaxID=869891 RepID=A0ABD6D6I2_9EURY|nr:FAD-dependent oxidoreductase [Halohasta litorea]